MKKLGFTLSEVIIALGIIGIIAAITTPLIGGIIPDKDKIQVLKYHKNLSNLIEETLNDPSLYLKFYEEGHTCVGLGCVDQPVNPNYQSSIYRGPNKLSYILASKLDLIASPRPVSAWKIEFITTDGVSLLSEQTAGGETEEGEELVYEITMDLNDTKAPNCFYSSSCKKPDRFKFYVDTYGKVTGNDPLTRAYLENPYKLNDRKKDYARAKELSSN